MVWVTNRSTQTIKVAISNNAGGDPGTYEITPEPLLVEAWGKNHWTRSKPETATVTFEKSGVTFQTSVDVLDVLIVYNDTYIVQPSTKQQWIS